MTIVTVLRMNFLIKISFLKRFYTRVVDNRVSVSTFQHSDRSDQRSKGIIDVSVYSARTWQTFFLDASCVKHLLSNSYEVSRRLKSNNVYYVVLVITKPRYFIYLCEI